MASDEVQFVSLRRVVERCAFREPALVWMICEVRLELFADERLAELHGYGVRPMQDAATVGVELWGAIGGNKPTPMDRVLPCAPGAIGRRFAD